jgi:spore germination protein GerM
MARHKKKHLNFPVRKLAGLFVSSLTGFLLLAAVGVYWALAPVARPDEAVMMVRPAAAAGAGANAMILEHAVKIYFGNSDKNKTAADCGAVYPLYREVPKTSTMMRNAINELIAGLSWNEADAGYFNAISGGTKVNSFTVDNGIARVDFDKRIKDGIAGTCDATEIKSQITSTLKQFPSVKSVVISVDGTADPTF